MRAHLYPIHYKMYEKILLWNELTDELAKSPLSGEQKTISKMNAKFGRLPRESLEGAIGESDIHDWLKSKIALVEGRLAFLVTEYKRMDPCAVGELKEKAFAFGRDKALPAGLNAQETFDLLDGRLLDGLPCEMANQVVAKTESRVSWVQVENVHSGYWTQNGGDVSDYEEIKQSFIDGMLCGTGISFVCYAAGVYSLTKTKHKKHA